jgi:hypothetical protein
MYITSGDSQTIVLLCRKEYPKIANAKAAALQVPLQAVTVSCDSGGREPALSQRLPVCPQAIRQLLHSLTSFVYVSLSQALFVVKCRC